MSLLGWVGRCGVVTVVGSVDGDVFERDHLAPKLRRGDIVIWDNHSLRRRSELRAHIKPRQAELVWQPRYSPQFNAVEDLWSKVKPLVRRALADTAAALREALAAAALSREDLLGWLCHSGYQISPDGQYCLASNFNNLLFSI